MQHPTIQKALTHLENANYSEYFDEMDNIENKMSSNLKEVYSSHKNKFISGNTDELFGQRLRTFATEVNKEILPKMGIYNHELIKPKSSAGWCLGREMDLEAIKKRLFDANDSLLLLVNGQGGIGKTTLALTYYDQHKPQYKHMAWLLAGESILNTVLELAMPLGLEFPPNMPYKERLEILVEKMQTLPAPCLLILDNANNLTDLDTYAKILQRCKNFHFLFTSRSKHEDTAIIEVKGLAPEVALQVFKKYYKNHKADEDELVLKVYEAVGRNTLVLEILAKNLHNINTRLQVHYPLPQMLQDIQQKGVLSIEQAEKPISVDWHDWEMESALPETFLREMYNLQKSPLSEAEKALLSVFAVLPAESVPFEVLKTLLEKKEEKKAEFKNFMAKMSGKKTTTQKHQETLDKIIISLEQKGWIEDEHKKDAFKCHAIVQTIIRDQHASRLWTDCKAMVEKLEFLFTTSNTYLINLHHNEAYQYAPIAESILRHLEEQNYTIGWLGIFFSDYYRSVGKLQEAFTLAGSTTKVFEKTKDTRSHSVCLERMGNIYVALGNFSEAIHLFEKRLQISKEAYHKKPHDLDAKHSVAIAYAKLGNAYNSLGNLEKALQFFEEDLKLSKELHQKAPKSESLKRGAAVAYSNIGNTYSSLGDLEKALQFFQANLRLSNDLHKNAPNDVDFKNGLATSYSKLGMIHLLLDDLQQASSNFYASRALLVELLQDNPLYKDLQANYAESIAVCWAIDALTGKEASHEVLQQASETFVNLYERTKIVNYKKKADIIARMQETGADLKALVVEMSKF